jgi:threonine dehydrogenase-like Zn-dependent dehydrogenase
MNTKRAVLTAPRRFEFRELDLSPASGEVLVKVAACGLCSWELNHWKGRLGDCPQTLGHEWAGTVVEAGAGVTALNVGDPVTGFAVGLTGFSEYTIAREDMCCKLASRIDPAYALGEPLKCIITVVRAALPEVGDHAVIQGCGPMGLWCIQALSGHLLSSLVAIDIDERKLQLARRFGATHTINAQTEDPRQKIAEVSDGHMADFVIEGTGIPSLLNTAQHYLRSSGRGRLVLMSTHEEPSNGFDFRETLARSAVLIGAYPAYSLNRMDDLRRAVTLLNQGVFRAQELVTHQFKLDDIQKAFETLERKPAGYIKGIVVP